MKSKRFFAKLAERAALSGNRREANRLLTAALYKGAVQATARAVLISQGSPA
jgi:hypothetical protein